MAHFTVDGPGLTRILHSLVLEGNDQHALRVMAEIEGLTPEQTTAILRGEGAFGGSTATDDLHYDAAPDFTAEYVAELRAFWGRRFSSGPAGKLREPYAIMAYGWGPEDARWAFKTAGASNLAKWFEARTLYYADDRSSDTVERIDVRGPNGVLCRAAGHLPAWVPREWLAQDVTEAASRSYLESLGANDGTASEDAPFMRGAREAAKAEILPAAVADAVVDAEAEHNLARRRAEINEQAERGADGKGGLGFFELHVERPDGDARPTSYRIPLAPWVLWDERQPFQPPADEPRWQTVCPSGMKMFNDDPNHTDWMVGAGIPVDALYGFDKDEPLAAAVTKARIRRMAVEGEALPARVLVRSKHPKVRGRVVQPAPGDSAPAGSVVVIPRADVDYHLVARAGSRRGGVVITAVGGSMSHIAKVGREEDIPLLLVADAVSKLPPGALVEVDFEAQTVRVVEPEAAQKARVRAAASAL